MVRRGLTDELRMDIGFINRRVGYVYLVDWDCKIRWAGSGNAEAEEREGLVNAVKRLTDAWKRETKAEVEKI